MSKLEKVELYVDNAGNEEYFVDKVAYIARFEESDLVVCGSFMRYYLDEEGDSVVIEEGEGFINMVEENYEYFIGRDEVTYDDGIAQIKGAGLTLLTTIDRSELENVQ